VFRHIVGVPIHRYLIRLRLRASLERLASVDEPGGAAWDLTGLALDLGYSSHSHFTDSFVREFGLTPSAFRNGLTRSRLREMSKIPKA
jgi:AraC-like DNA-binding protein